MTGAVLAVFELKSFDPFAPFAPLPPLARSTAELARQRDTVLYANRQVSGVLTWIQRNGPDDRVDHATAKRFRVQKVLPFVLGRYLVSLLTWLKVEADRVDAMPNAAARVIEVGEVRLVVHPSFAV